MLYISIFNDNNIRPFLHLLEFQSNNPQINSASGKFHDVIFFD
jgi:hypothetical protein